MFRAFPGMELPDQIGGDTAEVPDQDIAHVTVADWATRLAPNGTLARQQGCQVVGRAQDSIASIKRQVDLVVTHMLELGRRSQQIGGVLELVNELLEQTNILAINATIEAASAGGEGRRFAAVADEIRKLSDRVGGSAKEVRALVDEIRASVNTTVMATESGSKAVDSGTRQFGEVAAQFKHIAGQVATTTDAAREIELSTKQQATAVEQVNVAIAALKRKSTDNLTTQAHRLGFEPDLEFVERNPILVTALNPVIGYDKAAKIAKAAYAQGRRLKDVAAELTDLSAEELDRHLDPAAMTRPGL